VVELGHFFLLSFLCSLLRLTHSTDSKTGQEWNPLWSLTSRCRVDPFPLDRVGKNRISEILNASPEEDAEEWAVHDHEFWGHLSEYPGTNTLNAIQEAFEKVEAEGIDWEVFCEYCAHLGHDIEARKVEMFSEAYAGTADTLESIPENLRHYFDYAAYARDMEINDVFTIQHNGDTLVFWHR